MRETWVRSPRREDPLEKMTTHSSILAWKIPWTEEPSRLQSLGSRTRLSDKHTHKHTQPSWSNPAVCRFVEVKPKHFALPTRPYLSVYVPYPCFQSRLSHCSAGCSYNWPPFHLFYLSFSQVLFHLLVSYLSPFWGQGQGSCRSCLHGYFSARTVPGTK